MKSSGEGLQKLVFKLIYPSPFILGLLRKKNDGKSLSMKNLIFILLYGRASYDKSKYPHIKGEEVARIQK